MTAQSQSQPKTHGILDLSSLDEAIQRLDKLAADSRPADIVTWVIGAMFVGLTGVVALAFWLSFDHITSVAVKNGLAHGWMYPLVIDGVVLIALAALLYISALRLEQRRKWEIYGILATAELATIAFNLASAGLPDPLWRWEFKHMLSVTPPLGVLVGTHILLKMLEDRSSRKSVEVTIEEASERLATVQSFATDAAEKLKDALEQCESEAKAEIKSRLSKADAKLSEADQALDAARKQAEKIVSEAESTAVKLRAEISDLKTEKIKAKAGAKGSSKDRRQAALIKLFEDNGYRSRPDAYSYASLSRDLARLGHSCTARTVSNDVKELKLEESDVDVRG